MSFADSLREELCALPIKKPCCRRALAAAFLLTATREGGGLVRIRVGHEQAATLLSESLAKVYSKVPEVTAGGSHGHRYWELTLASPAASKLTAQLQNEDADAVALLHLDACESCRSSFLRGLFFSCGSVSDPQKLSHLEFSMRGDTTDVTARALDALGYPPKRVTRQGKCGLYYKNANAVRDLVTLMGSHNLIYRFYNAQIERDIRNDENRATNCVARNIEKSVSAAARQMEAIGVLMEHGRFDALPEPVRQTALLRYQNPDATLDELRALHKPPISKSGLSHRLQKLTDAAEK